MRHGLLAVQKACFGELWLMCRLEKGAKRSSSKQNNFIARSQGSISSEIFLDSLGTAESSSQDREKSIAKQKYNQFLLLPNILSPFIFTRLSESTHLIKQTPKKKLSQDFLIKDQNSKRFVAEALTSLLQVPR
jgi:hypothetical protein